ncbi:MAG TPA: hypothetical protein VGL10_07510 [Gammaproteobacteria bacterium]
MTGENRIKELEMKDPKAERSKEIREWVQIALIVFTVGWTSYEFFFKEFIKPAQEPTALELDAKLERAGEKDGFIMIKGTIKANNPTNRRIYVPAFWYTVKARKLATAGEPARQKTGIDPNDPLQNKIVRKYAPVTSYEIVAQQRIIFEGEAWWDPKDRTNDEIIFAIPKNKFDFLDMKISYLFTRNNSELAAPAWILTEDGSVWAELRFKQEKSEDETIAWIYKNGAGYNWSTNSLSLWEQPKN